MILIDSSIWIDAFRRDGNVITKLAIQEILDHDKALLCGPIALEVVGAARQNERKRLRTLFSDLQYYRSTDALWRDAIGLSWRIRDRGLNLPWNDILIANIAMETRAWIYTKDKHFEELSKFLPIFLYRPGYNGAFNPDYS